MTRDFGTEGPWPWVVSVEIGVNFGSVKSRTYIGLTSELEISVFGSISHRKRVVVRMSKSGCRSNDAAKLQPRNCALRIFREVFFRVWDFFSARVPGCHGCHGVTVSNSFLRCQSRHYIEIIYYLYIVDIFGCENHFDTLTL